MLRNRKLMVVEYQQTWTSAGNNGSRNALNLGASKIATVYYSRCGARRWRGNANPRPVRRNIDLKQPCLQRRLA